MEKCQKCGAGVAPTAKFCCECGAKIEHKKYCPECGTEVKPEQKFCMECGTRLIVSETLALQPKTEPEQSKAVTAEDEIQKICNDIKASLEKLEMAEFVWFGNDFDGHYYREDRILPEDVDIWELLDETVPDMHGELRYGDYYELIRKVRIENGNLLFEVGGYNALATFIEEENWRLHENFTKDDLVNEYGEKAVKSHLESLLASFEDEEILKLNKMILRPKSNEKGKKKSESKTSKKEEKQSKKKSEPKLDKETSKELTDLYKKAVAYQIGKNGAEKDIMFALECYYEYLEKAPASHSRYLDVHYGLARICTEMGDGCHNLGMDDEALDWYNDAVEHYEVILVKYPKKPLNERILAECAYDKVREKLKKLK